MRKLLVLLIISYRNFISPVLALLGFSSCRFSPTCSQFALSSVKKYGAQKGLILFVKRLVRCQPFAKTIYD